MRAAVELAGYTPSESDELRKAISKKKKEDIDKHRAKFVKGAVEKGMEQSTADAIYMDWEEFARYGFNKSHAADYGVIAVQTAYLKAHYPAEYMAALMSASAGRLKRSRSTLRMRAPWACPCLHHLTSTLRCGISPLKMSKIRQPTTKRLPASALGWAPSRTSVRTPWNRSSSKRATKASSQT
jgi:hypothetical protein